MRGRKRGDFHEENRSKRTFSIKKGVITSKQNMNQGAHFSPDRRYRYSLWRIWNEDKPLVMFIGLNPSTANEREPDPTIRRVMKFAYNWGYGGIYMMNLFAFVTAYPIRLAEEADPLGDNNGWLDKIAINCEMIVFAWGAFGDGKGRQLIRDRAESVKALFPGAYCIAKTKTGHPGHPLFLPGYLKPFPYFENVKV